MRKYFRHLRHRTRKRQRGFKLIHVAYTPHRISTAAAYHHTNSRAMCMLAGTTLRPVLSQIVRVTFELIGVYAKSALMCDQTVQRPIDDPSLHFAHPIDGSLVYFSKSHWQRGSIHDPQHIHVSFCLTVPILFPLCVRILHPLLHHGLPHRVVYGLRTTELRSQVLCLCFELGEASRSCSWICARG